MTTGIDSHDGTTPTAVAVVGTGTMGAAMARRLLSCGHPVRAWNRSPEPLVELERAGADVFKEAAEAVSYAPVALTLLPTAAVAADVMLDRGAIDAMAPGSVWAQMGTIGVGGTARLQAEAESRRHDVAFVDAPVSGSRGPAESGELIVLASGPQPAAALLDPVFSALGRRTLWLGPAGAGSRVKLVLNTWLAFEVEAAAEVGALATAFGIAGDTLTNALQGSPLVSGFAAAKLAKMQTGDDREDFSLAWALKDLDLVGEAVDTGVAPVARAIAERWRGLVSDGLGVLDVSAARHGLGETPEPTPR